MVLVKHFLNILTITITNEKKPAINYISNRIFFDYLPDKNCNQID